MKENKQQGWNWNPNIMLVRLCKVMQLLWKTVWQFLKRLNIVTIRPSDSTPGRWKQISTKSLYINVHSRIIYTSQEWKQPRSSSTDEQMNIMWNIDTTEHNLAIKRNEWPIHAITWTDLKTLVSERSQTQNAAYYMFLIVWNVQKRQIYRNRK